MVVIIPEYHDNAMQDDIAAKMFWDSSPSFYIPYNFDLKESSKNNRLFLVFRLKEERLFRNTIKWK